MQTINEWIKINVDKQEKDWDIVWCIAGGERKGKSNLGLTIFEEFCRLKGFTPNMDWFAVDMADFIRAIDISPGGGIVVLDEAGDSLTSSNYFDDLTKKLREAYTIIGAKRLFTIIILPDFFLLDTYFRKWRVKSLLYVFNRGRVALYCGSDMYKLNLYATDTKNVFKVKPSGYDTFPIYTGDLLKQYKHKKDTKVKNSIRELQEELGLGDTISLKKAAKFVRVSYPTALKMVIDGKLPAVKTSANRYKVRISDLDIFMKENDKL